MSETTPFSRRTLARMLACDILYQMDLTGEDLEKVTQDFLRMLQEGIEDERVPPQDIPGISLEHVRRLLGTSAEIEGLVSFASESFEYPEGIPEFSRELVDLYMSNREEIDGLLASYADRWSLERMPMVDRNLLRLGFAELLFRGDIPANVTINEYLELAKAFSTEDSGKFINGVLGKLVRDRGLGGEGDGRDYRGRGEK
ncbi:MAG: transcription antitermination factor NusB [Actinomycetota bacterium]|nr:transcription antitermination factor NusB [Actinomycetota bacterium]MDD5666035.1 transcription antitermination factor NusB [Actinomycetota bacterium]